MALGGREWDVFEFLRGLVMYSSYQVKPTTEIESYHYLGIYATKVSSAWTDDWSCTWPSTASITALGGREWDDFGGSGRPGDIE